MDLLLLGLGLGLAAGISPGPLLTLVIASALERGFGAGLRVAVAPPLTDAPIILLALVLLEELPDAFLAALGLVGGCLVMYLGLRTLRTWVAIGSGLPAVERGDRRDLWRGALVNFFNPHPWLSWITVMGPITVQAWRTGPLRAVAFVAGFYLAIVSSKMAIAWIVARTGQRLSLPWRRRLVRSSGMLLLGLGLLLVWRALDTPDRAQDRHGNQLQLGQELEDRVCRQAMSELVRMWIGEGDRHQSPSVHAPGNRQQMEHGEPQSLRRSSDLRKRIGVGIRSVELAVEDGVDNQEQGDASFAELESHPAQCGTGSLPARNLEQGSIGGDHQLSQRSSFLGLRIVENEAPDDQVRLQALQAVSERAVLPHRTPPRTAPVEELDVSGFACRRTTLSRDSGLGPVVVAACPCYEPSSTIDPCRPTDRAPSLSPTPDT